MVVQLVREVAMRARKGDADAIIEKLLVPKLLAITPTLYFFYI